MKMALVCGCGLAWCCATCSGQTNCCQEHGPALFFPPIHLRLEKSIEPQKLTEESARSEVTKIQAFETTLADGSVFHSRLINENEFHLTRIERPEGGVARALDNIFTPEVVHLGKIPVSGSIVTAIKRKNPLCLLSPIIFQISW